MVMSSWIPFAFVSAKAPPGRHGAEVVLRTLVFFICFLSLFCVFLTTFARIILLYDKILWIYYNRL